MSLWRPATFERALSSYGAKITMATIGQVKDLLKKELEPLHSKLETMCFFCLRPLSISSPVSSVTSIGNMGAN